MCRPRTPFRLTNAQRRQIIRIGALKTGRLWRYTHEYIAALYDVTRERVGAILREAGLDRGKGTGRTWR